MDIFNFKFSIDWPGRSKDLLGGQHPWAYNRTWQIGPHKYLEVQFEPMWDTLFEFCAKWSIECDHAGGKLTVGLFRSWLDINVYDSRHWNYEKNRYQTQEDIVEEYGEHLTTDEVRTIINESADKITADPANFKKIIKQIKQREIWAAVLTELIHRNINDFQVQEATVGLSKFMSDYNINHSWWLKRKENGEKFKG